MMKQEIAEIDTKHLAMLRKNVTDFMVKSAALYDRKGLLLLDVAPQDHEGTHPYFAQAKIETLDIDSQSGATYIADMCQNNAAIIPSEHFDIIVCTEVLEHTLKPFRAVEEIWRMLKPGGLTLVSVPFNFRIHGPLPDCWRFTEHGLRSLFDEEAGFEMIELVPLQDGDRFLMPIHYTLVARKLPKA